MSTLSFKFDDWIRIDDPDPRRASTAAQLVISVDDIAATRLLDLWSQTVTDRARLPLYPLAEWLAANWWRIHAEAPYEGGYPPLDWRLSHDMAAIGGGLIWPPLRFASDGETIQVSAQTSYNARWEPVRHLSDIHPPRAVTVESFDRAVEDLINLVLRRTADLGVSSEPLATIWSDVLAERAHCEFAEWRHWEARLGYDPGCAPECLMEQLAGLFDRAGKSATAEVVPLLSAREPAMLDRLMSVAEARGVEAELPTQDIGPTHPSEPPPWAAGRRTARKLREILGGKTGPIDDAMLHSLLGIKARALDDMPADDTPIGLGVRHPQGAAAILHFRKRNPAGIRFECARFLAESLSAPAEDLWLPLTDRATARQKFQRAFAAEFLAPIDEVSDRLGSSRTSESVEDVADEYCVSPLAIRSHLANHGLLAPDEVAV